MRVAHVPPSLFLHHSFSADTCSLTLERKDEMTRSSRRKEGLKEEAHRPSTLGGRNHSRDFLRFYQRRKEGKKCMHDANVLRKIGNPTQIVVLRTTLFPVMKPSF